MFTDLNGAFKNAFDRVSSHPQCVISKPILEEEQHEITYNLPDICGFGQLVSKPQGRDNQTPRYQVCSHSIRTQQGNQLYGYLGQHYM